MGDSTVVNGQAVEPQSLYDYVMPDNEVRSLADQSSVGNTPTAEAEDAQELSNPVDPTEYQLEVPAGYEVSTDDIQTFKDMARDMVLTNDQANQLLKMHLERVSESVKSAVERAGDEWLLAAKRDPEIGGAKLAEHLRASEHVLARFGGEKLRETLIKTQLANHPELIRFLAKIGRAMGEGSYNNGAATQQKRDVPLEELLYK